MNVFETSVKRCVLANEKKKKKRDNYHKKTINNSKYKCLC